MPFDRIRYKLLQIQISWDLHAALVKRAASEGKSMSEMVRALLAEGVKR